MKRSIKTRGLGVVALFGSVHLMLAQQITHPDPVSLHSIVESLEHSQGSVREQVPYYWVTREYSLSRETGSKADSAAIAVIEFRPPANKSYRIQRVWGSSMQGQQVIRRALDHELEEASHANQSRSAINRNNYDFSYLGEADLDGKPCYRLGLKPIRKEVDLILGEVWVDKSTFLVRQIEGEAAKVPSWWLKKVHVKLRFASLNGIWQPTSMEAVADVRILGVRILSARALNCGVANEIALAGTSVR